ncbi:MAG TPA: class I SAM-dependent methyltransferase [Holophaga sp.]|nr:class I SAM-dependent methyltransferase [Holophaga sp.]
MNAHPPFPTQPFMAPWTPLLRLFKGLPRKGPGSEASTLRALSLCPLPARPRAADFGCGSGAATLVLARELQAPILALDADGTALDDLYGSARDRGLLHLVRPRPGDMASPGLETGSLDLLWSEGAVAHLGLEAAFRVWTALLAPGGVMAFTDATWFDPDPPEEARRAWAQWYPTMGTEAGNLRIAREAGLRVLGHFRLPSQDWWDYYDGVAARFPSFAEDEGLAPVIAAQRAEMDLYRRTGSSYGYVFYVLRKPQEPSRARPGPAPSSAARTRSC